MPRAETVYDRLRWVYAESGAGTYAAFAGAIGVTPSAITKLLGEQTEPTLGTLVAISARYGWSIHWMATGQGHRLATLAEGDEAIWSAGVETGLRQAAARVIEALAQDYPVSPKAPSPAGFEQIRKEIEEQLKKDQERDHPSGPTQRPA